MLNETLQSLLDEFAAEIGGAAKRGEFRIVQRLTDAAAKVADVRDQLAGSIGNGQLRKFSVVVSDGALKNDYLNLTEAVNAGVVAIGEQMTIYCDSGTFKTVLLPRKYLQERSGIAAFYQKAGIHVGDVVTLTETARNTWHLERG